MNTTKLASQLTPAPIVHSPRGEMVKLEPNPVKMYALDFWQTLSEGETATVYKKALLKTWELLKQVIILILSFFLLLLAIFIFIWGMGFRWGQDFATWLNEKERQPEEFVMILLNLLLEPIKKAIAWANNHVEKYLGWKPFDCEVLKSPENSSPSTPVKPK